MNVDGAESISCSPSPPAGSWGSSCHWPGTWSASSPQRPSKPIWKHRPDWWRPSVNLTTIWQHGINESCRHPFQSRASTNNWVHEMEMISIMERAMRETELIDSAEDDATEGSRPRPRPWRRWRRRGRGSCLGEGRASTSGDRRRPAGANGQPAGSESIKRRRFHLSPKQRNNGSRRLSLFFPSHPPPPPPVDVGK